MQRNIFALIVGTALVGAAALAACSSGGGSSPSPTVNTNSLSPGGSQLTSNGRTFTFTINRAPVAKPHRQGQSAQRTATGTRKPEYIAQGMNGLQIAVTATGVSSVTQYLDISASSPLCSSSGPTETCTLTIPTIASTEKITMTEVDQVPTNAGVGPNPPGYGSGFPVNTNILAVGSTTSTSGGATSLTLGLSPVLAQVKDCFWSFGTLTPTATTNAAFDAQTSNYRIVVTAGVAQAVSDVFCFLDAGSHANYSGGTPLPVVDVNGSAAPVTFTSNSQHVLVGLYSIASSAPTPSAQTVSMPDTSMIFYGNCIAYDLKFDGNLAQPATLTVSNNLTTLSPFTNTSYATSDVVTLVPLSITATPAPISQGGATTTTVTASDYMGTGGLTPFALVNSSGVGSNAGACLDSGSTVRARVASTGSITTTTWLQSFTITPAATPTVASPVTCTFVLGDVNTGATGRPGYTVTPTVTVTVNP